MKNIEVEIRSFIEKEKYNDLLSFFNKEGELINKDYQETYYFDSEEDLRIQKNNFYSKIWLKKGEIHDDHREEIEIKFHKDDFENLEKVFLSLGYDIEIKWFRTRHHFKWEGVDVMIDFTKGYGYIIELEKMSTQENKEDSLDLLKKKMNKLGIPISSKEQFKEQFENYRKKWKELIRND